jgi:type I restriction enzyme S subunit
MSAPLARVGDLATQVRGVSYGKEDASATPLPGYLPVLRAGNITDNGLVFDDLVFVPAERISTQQRVRRDDVVVAASSGSLDVVGKAAPALADFEGGFGAFCKVLRPTAKVHPRYFAHFFKTQDYRRRVSALAAGANINNLRNEHLDEMQIPVPSLTEQQKIAEVLDRGEALRAKRRAAIAQLDTLTQSIFFSLFGDPESNSNSYPLRALADSIQLKGGFAFKSADYVSDGIPLIRIGEVNRGRVTPGCACFLPRGYTTSHSRFVIRPGDMLMSLTGTTGKDDYGNVIILDSTFDQYLLNQRVALLQPDSKLLDKHYLFYLLRQPKIKSKLTAKSRGIRQANISNGDVLELRVPLPPLFVQHEFACGIATVEKLKAAHSASLTELDNLFCVLQHRAFRGEL